MLKLHTQATFSREIEKMVRELKIGYWEAVCEYCEQTGLEPETVPKLLSQQIKAQIEEEATALNLINRGEKKLNKL